MAFLKRKIVKRLLKSPLFQQGVARLLSLYLHFVYRTSTWEVLGFERTDGLVRMGPTIACFWHGHLAMIPFMQKWPHKRNVALISAHGDGQLVARTFKYFNIEKVSGSTNKGGTSAFRKLLKALKEGHIAAIIPDGPRGPARKMSPGIIKLAQYSQAPIIPLAYGISRFLTLRSWDKMKVPLPFSRGVFIYGEPFYVKREASQEVSADELQCVCQNLEKALNNLQDQANDLAIKLSRKE